MKNGAMTICDRVTLIYRRPEPVAARPRDPSRKGQRLPARHPAARASASVQNQRSPFASLILVRA